MDYSGLKEQAIGCRDAIEALKDETISFSKAREGLDELSGEMARACDHLEKAVDGSLALMGEVEAVAVTGTLTELKETASRMEETTEKVIEETAERMKNSAEQIEKLNGEMARQMGELYERLTRSADESYRKNRNLTMAASAAALVCAAAAILSALVM